MDSRSFVNASAGKGGAELAPPRRFKGIFVVFILAALGVACVFGRIDVTPVDTKAHYTVVRTPVKAHLIDGSTVVFPDGVTVTPTALQGAGRRYDLSLDPDRARDVTSVDLDDVLAVEAFRDGFRAGPTLAANLVGIPATLAGSALLAVAIFGSCPTIYSGEGDGQVLEGEAFPESVMPAAEAETLHRLRATPDRDGKLSLEVRNEALETHQLNRLQVLVAGHAPDEEVVSDVDGRPILVRELGLVSSARDRRGRDVRPGLAAVDGQAVGSSRAALDAIDAGEIEDWLDLEAPAPEGPEAAIVLRLRNSLLGTVLFYDGMIAGSGPRSLDRLAGDVGDLASALAFGEWYTRRTGLHLLLEQNGEWREVARLRDTGPIGWRDVALVMPVPAGARTLRFRLSSTTDLWRIDSIRVGSSRGPALTRVVSAAGFESPGTIDPAQALAALAEADSSHLETRPGERFRVTFDVGPPSPAQPRTYLFAARGYYTEWVRRDWLREPARPFVPGDDATRTALLRWRSIRSDFERDFFSSRIPVR